MKRLFILVVLLFVQLVSAQIHLSLRDNRYAGLGYHFLDKYDLKLEHSMFPEKIGFQYIRANAEADFSIEHLMISYKLYSGMLYNQNFYDVGADLKLDYILANRIDLFANVNPHYDSGCEYETNYGAGASVRLYKGMWLWGQYTTVPEYRMSEKRIRVGFIFKENNLRVIPVISIPAKREIKSTRVLVSMDYSL